MKDDISELVGEQQWLEDDKDGKLYCPTELAIRQWGVLDSWEDGYDIWLDVKLHEIIFEQWEIDQDESFNKYPKPKKILLFSDDFRDAFKMASKIASMSWEVVMGPPSVNRFKIK